MRMVSILPLLLLVLLFLSSGLNAAYISVPDERGFYITTNTWDGADHVKVYSQKIYSSVSYYVEFRAFWRENTLYIMIEGVDAPKAQFLMIGPASTEISTFDTIADGTYNIVSVWDGGAKSYLVTKQNVNIEVTDVNGSFADAFFCNILFLTPWVSLLVCLGLFVVYRFRAQFIAFGKKIFGGMISASVKKEKQESLNKAKMAVPLLVAGYGIFNAFLAITSTFYSGGTVWTSYRLVISASIVYLGWLFYRIVKASNSIEI